jgi:hypothetical protein
VAIQAIEFLPSVTLLQPLIESRFLRFHFRKINPLVGNVVGNHVGLEEMLAIDLQGCSMTPPKHLPQQFAINDTDTAIESKVAKQPLGNTQFEKLPQAKSTSAMFTRDPPGPAGIPGFEFPLSAKLDMIHVGQQLFQQLNVRASRGLFRQPKVAHPPTLIGFLKFH